MAIALQPAPAPARAPGARGVGGGLNDRPRTGMPGQSLARFQISGYIEIRKTHQCYDSWTQGWGCRHDVAAAAECREGKIRNYESLRQPRRPGAGRMCDRCSTPSRCHTRVDAHRSSTWVDGFHCVLKREANLEAQGVALSIRSIIESVSLRLSRSGIESASLSRSS